MNKMPASPLNCLTAAAGKHHMTLNAAARFGKRLYIRPSKQNKLPQEICLFVCAQPPSPVRFPCRWSRAAQKTTHPQRPAPFELSHNALMACSLFTTSWILKRMHAYPVGIFPLFLHFSFFPFRLASPCPPPPLSHWSSLTEKVWNRLRVGPQNKEAWQRFKSVWS